MTGVKTRNKKFLVSLFHDMLRIRLIEERIAELYPEQEMRCPVHLSIGQEAVAVGVCASLTENDPALSGHRAHGHYLAKGGDLNRFFAEIYGKVTGCSRGRGGSMHLFDLSVNFLGSTPIIASTIPVAVGVAFAEKAKKRHSVTTAFFGDAAVEEGVFHEAVNFAALKKLPVLFICENNFYSVYTPLSERQPDREIRQLAAGHGIPAFREDGNDVLKVYETAKKAVAAIRKNSGPVFLEFLTYRWREHCGPNFDNHLGYRSEAEFKSWQKKCPIVRFKKYLSDHKLISAAEIKQMEESIIREIDAAVKFAKTSPFEEKEVSLADVYAP